MKLSSLAKYFQDESSFVNLVVEMKNAVGEFKLLSSKQGASMPVILNEDVEYLKVGAKELKTLCTSFLEGHLDKYFISYIADALLLSSKTIFDDDIKERIEELTDLEINGELTKERVLEILIELQN